MNFLTLETERLFMRPTTEEDAAFILALLNMPKWIQFIGDRGVHTEEEAANYIRTRMLPQLERLGFSNYTVIRKEDETKIGVCGLYDREGLEGVDIGFAFLPEYEGKGYAFEAASRMLQAGKENFGLTLVKAITIEENQSSRRLLEKLGLSFQKKMFMDGDPVELMLYEKNLIP